MRNNIVFWIIAAILVIAGAVPRLLIYDFSLPYIDHPDEGTSYLEAKAWRGAYDLGGGHPGYPPGHIALNYVVQQVVEGWLNRNITASITVMRLLSVTFNLLTLIAIMIWARMIAGTIAALFAGALWAVSPMVITNGIIAIPDPLLYLLVTLAGLTATAALLRPDRRLWTLISCAIGLMAVVVKYQAFPALFPAAMVALLTLRTRPRQGIQLIVIQLIAIAGVAAALFWGYGALRSFGSNRETVAMTESGLSNVLSPMIVLNNIYRVFLPIHDWLTVSIVVIGGIAFVIAWRFNRERINIAPLAIGLPLLLFIPWVASSFAVVGTEGSLIRHVMPVTPFACVLVGVAVMQIVGTLHGTSLRVQWGLYGVMALLFVALIIVPDVRQLTHIIPQYRLPDSRVAIRQWADVNLEAGTVVVDNANHKTFNPFWGGIEGRQWFDWWEIDNFMTYSVEEWRDERGMSYMAIPLDKWEQMRQLEEGQAYLDRLLFLREFSPPPAMRGPEIRFYRLWGIQHEADVHFGERIRLLGYDLPEQTTFSAGDVIPLRLYWRADDTPLTNYSIFLHLTEPDSREVITQLDRPPTVENRPTVTWTVPNETLISPRIDFPLPSDIPAGTYRILLGVYNFETFERLPVDTGSLGDAYMLLQFTVE